MNPRSVQIAAVFVLLMLALGCSAGSGNPTEPGLQPQQPNGDATACCGDARAQTHLWGYYDVYIDIENQTATVVLNRQAMFTANVVKFINGNPAYLGFKINGTPTGPDYVDVDIDVGITHPFPGLPAYNGYDVRGVFMGDGSRSMAYNGDLIYSVFGEGQFMLPDPVDGHGGPDGYTRWFNYSEFTTGGMPLFSYTPGKAATPGFVGAATLNPYRYFADSLATNENLWDWLVSHAEYNGQFSSGATNDRNYYLRFPKAKGVVFGYAIVASWVGPEDENHPANAPEAVGCKVVDKSNVWFVDPSENGGKMNLDISIFDWGSQISAGVMEDYKLFIESTVLSAVHESGADEMTPVGGNENYSTYHVEIPADDVTQLQGNEYWVIVEYPDFDYTNEFGVINDAWEDSLAAFFRYDLDVSPEPTNQDPTCDLVIDPSSPSMPFEGWGAFTFDASGSYDPDGDPITFEWDFDNDGEFGDYYNFGTPEKPVKVFEFTNQEQVCVKVSDGLGGESVCCVDVDIVGFPSKNIPLREGVEAVDIAIDHTNGDLLVLYEDKKIYKYSREDYYQSGGLFISVTQSLPQTMIAIDMSANRYIALALTYVTPDTPGIWVYDPDGNFITGIGQGPPAPLEAFAMTGGSYVNDLGYIRGYDNYTSGYPVTVAFRLDDAFWYPPPYNHNFTISDGNNYGIEKVYYGFVKGSESDLTGNYMWFLEDPDYYASRWALTKHPTYEMYYLEYNSAYFGTGSQTDDDDGWNDGKDITRDNLNRYFVLDELSTGEPRVKVWTVSGTTTTSIGGFGDFVTISETPRRVEGSDYEGIIVVLHGDSAPAGYKISAFLPGEMPG